jgi:hypothetical protein
MYPVNQVILGGGDPLLGSPQLNYNSVEEQLRNLDAKRQSLETLKQLNSQATPVISTPIWDEIDAEIKVLTYDQQNKLFENEDYISVYSELNNLVQQELINSVKYKIENSPRGNKLLQDQLKLLKTLKNKIIESSNREMELFKSFQEFSKANPNVTYEQFLNTIK